MFLKRIELAGFKSFADKTELEFVEGITAVVGPNGSGKSNISDGIRWVLGEQSARSLRGGKMEDVIFAGSDSRKPVGYGEVSITLDNTDQSFALDYSEITVTRRIHRSGDSDYFMNKQSCRLKDITELFMDTGIGKEAYSMIGQGRIEEILSTRSEDRRAIFEEASGIVKYKSRKKETTKKLDDTEQNLVRIHDLISELEDQIDPLREQADKAERYKALKEELKRREIAMYVQQIEQIHQTWNEANEELQQLEQRQTELSTVVSRQDAELEEQRFRLRQMEEQLEQEHERLLRLSEQFEKCEGQGEVLKERKRNLSLQMEQLQSTLESQDQRLDGRKSEVSTLQKKIAEAEDNSAAVRRELQQEEEQFLGLDGTGTSEAEERVKTDRLDMLNEIAHVRNDIRYAEQQLEMLERRKGRLKEDQNKFLEKKLELEQHRQQLEQERVRLSADLEKSRSEYVQVSKEIQQLQHTQEEIGLSLRKQEQKRDAIASRRDTLKELQSDYDGFATGVKDVLRAKDRANGLHGIHGAVAELIHVPQEYEQAMETALGGALQNIVVAAEADARAAIEYLKRRNSGRATFLPLNVVRGRRFPDRDRQSIQHEDGFIGTAIDLIRFDSQYTDVVSNLLGVVLVAKDLPSANHIAARCNYRYRIVTLDGDVVHPGGSMTGGSQRRKTSNLLGRQRLIEELDHQISESEAAIEEICAKADALKSEYQRLNQQNQQLRETGEELRIQEQHARSELASTEKNLQTMEEQAQIFSQDDEALELEWKQLEDKKAEDGKKLALLQEQDSELQQQLSEAESARKAQESARNELQNRLTELKVKLATADQAVLSIKEQYRQQKLELDSAMEERRKNEEAAAGIAEEQKRTEEQLVQQMEELNQLQIDKTKSTETIEFKRAERAKTGSHIEQEENKTKEERNALKAAQDKLHQVEVRTNRLDVELDNLLKQLAEDYEISFELAKERFSLEEEELSQLQTAVRHDKQQISALGDVNLGAIEEYKRISERFQFLDGQRNDLMEAKATLYQVIRDMEAEMSRRFRTTFDAVRSHFVIVFAQLFGGGRADLILSDPQNMLETGIEIVAQPPGKKLQNIQLLSGGEKALTAIALLFSIIRVKPVPFCVLDEVEAALDEANVSRFAQYLREFSNQTQFIVVTHRKGTMEEADVLYGITMEDDGVSKLVSVRLDDEEPDPEEFAVS